jgi:hypothetical protein
MIYSLFTAMSNPDTYIYVGSTIKENVAYSFRSIVRGY